MSTHHAVGSLFAASLLACSASLKTTAIETPPAVGNLAPPVDTY